MPEALLAILVLIACPWLSRTGTAPVRSEDEAAYLLLGEALHDGRGYVSAWLPGAPRHGLYPPGFPVLLAGVWRATGPTLAAAEGTTIALSLLSLVLAYALFRRLSGRGGAFACIAVLACSPLFWRFSGPVLSEAAALVFVLATLLAGEVWRERGGPRGMCALSIASGAVGLSVRMANLALLLAWPIAAAWPGGALTRRARVVGGIAALLVAAALVAGWSAWVRRAAPEPGGGYLGAMFSRDLRDFDQPQATVGDFAARVGGAARTYAGAIPDEVFHHFEKLGPARWPGRVALLGLIGWGGVLLVRRGRVLTATWALGHLALILLHPAFEGGRFLHPLLPVLLLCTWEALRAAGGTRCGGRLAAAAAVVACASALRVTVATAPGLSPQESPPMERYLDVARRVRASSSPGSVVVCRKPRVLARETGLFAVCYPFTRDPQAHAELIRSTGATWIVADELSPTTTEYLLPTLDRLPVRVVPVFANGETRAYRVGGP